MELPDQNPAAFSTPQRVIFSKGYYKQELDVRVSLRFEQDNETPDFTGLCYKSGDTFHSSGLRLLAARSLRGTLEVIFIIALFILILLLHATPIIDDHYRASVLYLPVMIVGLAFAGVVVGQEVWRDRAKLKSIVGRCASIGELHLANLNRELLSAVRTSLGGIPIKHLFVYDRTYDAGLRKIIVEMARKHQVERITICTDELNDCKLSELFLKIAEHVESLEICESPRRVGESEGIWTMLTSLFFESKNETGERIFGKPREFWAKKLAEKGDGAFSAQVMNGEQRELCDSVYLLRFKVNA